MKKACLLLKIEDVYPPGWRSDEIHSPISSKCPLGGGARAWAATSPWALDHHLSRCRSGPLHVSWRNRSNRRNGRIVQPQALDVSPITKGAVAAKCWWRVDGGLVVASVLVLGASRRRGGRGHITIGWERFCAATGHGEIERGF
jgi:hypothetical protein